MKKLLWILGFIPQAILASSSINGNEGVVIVDGVSNTPISATNPLPTTTTISGGVTTTGDITKWNGITVVSGNGTTGTGSPRVTIASDNTPFSVNAVQSGTWHIGNITGTISLPTGAATNAGITGVSAKTLTDLNTTLGSPLQAGGTVGAVTTITNALPSGTNVIGHVIVDTSPTTAVTNSGLTNLDVALSTRTKPSDQQHTIIDSGSSTAVPLIPTTTDCSGTITLGGTAQTLVSGSKYGFELMNNDTTEPLCYSLTGTAGSNITTQGTYCLNAATSSQSGGYYSSSPGSTTVTINATTTGHKFTCTKRT